MTVKIAVCQVPDIKDDIENAFRWIERFTKEAEEKNVSLICFPECFLQGYITDEFCARKNAVNLHDEKFSKILNQLKNYASMIVLGLIEEDERNLYNTAVVIKDGLLMGKYRKTHLLDGEKIFTAGHEYPTFEINDLKFGINICYDTQFPEASANLVNQGAQLILCPSNTMMSYKKAKKFKHLHLPMRAERAKENNVWLLSSDIVGEREGRVAYGTTSAINPDGEIINQLPLMETRMIIIEL